ncbi:MAG TPA: maleylpyruvate isomerase N-terminal domain-containing protein [Acidimicrobiia bacterium]
MRLTPLYGGGAPIAFDGPIDDQAEPLTRQRRRFRATLADLDDAQWRAPTRCDGWAVSDVVAHLVTVDGFWEASVRAALAGSPTEVLANFDPAAHPPLLIAPLQQLSRTELLERYERACEGFLDALASVRGEQWNLLGESPAGHVSLRLVAQHALWDCWVHERDVALPLDIAPAAEPDEVTSCLRYAVAIGPHLVRNGSAADRVVGTFGVVASAPDFVITVTVGDEVIITGIAPPQGAPLLRGNAAALTDALSVRGPLPGDAPPEWHTLARALAAVFDAPPR